ncbi:hypothetical protein H1R20_g13520, partial [Candolleomyces eurysporus]
MRSGSVSSSASTETDATSDYQSRCSSKPKRYNSKDVWHFFQKDASSQRYSCIFCLSRAAADPEESVQRYNKKSGTGTLRRHLYGNHRDDWVAECDRRGIKITAKEAQKHVRLNIPEYTHDGFIDALVDFIVADDQSINVIESAFFRRLLLMLREDLRDEDIPHRTFVRNHIQSRWKDYMKELQAKLQGSVGRISLTTDLWSDTNLRPFMAVTAHWIEAQTVQTTEGPVTNLALRADLIAFHNMPGRHTGEHLGTALLHVLDRLNIAAKIGWVTIDNASNNDTMMVHLASSLNQRRILFSARDNRIRCFPHVTNLACKAVLSAVTNIGLAAVNDEETDPEREVVSTAPDRDTIAHVRTLVRFLKPYRQQMGANTPAPCRTTIADSWADDALGSPITRVDNRNRSIQAEVDAYLVDGRVGSGCTIKFWQENREEYPTLSQLAIDILPIPGSAVPCERVFSSAKETMTSRRGRILPGLMEALQMLKFSLKKSLCLDFTAGTDREAEIAAMEAAAANLTRLPDDITSYISHLLHGVESDEDTDEDREDVEADN